jgi:chromosome partitioning protein
MGSFMSILHDLGSELLAKILVGLLTLILLPFVYFLLRWLFEAHKSKSQKEAALQAVARSRDVDERVIEGPGFWLKEPIERPPGYDADMRGSIPILLIATLKGGVGKTTLAVNLAAHFAMRWKRSDTLRPLRVLLLEGDFQGSLATMTVSDDARFEQPSKANRMFSGEHRGGGLGAIASPITRPGMVPGLTIATIPAYYDLAQAENRAMIEWLLPRSDVDLINRVMRLLKLGEGKPLRSDVRYFLAESLLQRDVQTSFDLVIIDAPPRLTTAHVQAMCASTHLLVPTILDRLSGDAVARYLSQIATHKNGPNGNGRLAICRHLSPVGVVCTMVPNTSANLTVRLESLRAAIAASGLSTDLLDDCIIRHRPAYAECAGESIAYASTSSSREYANLREELDRLGLRIGPTLVPKGRWVPPQE